MSIVFDRRKKRDWYFKFILVEKIFFIVVIEIFFGFVKRFINFDLQLFSNGVVGFLGVSSMKVFQVFVVRFVQFQQTNKFSFMIYFFVIVCGFFRMSEIFMIYIMGEGNLQVVCWYNFKFVGNCIRFFVRFIGIQKFNFCVFI